MSLDLLSKWLGFWSPLSLGQFANPRANGLGLTAGVFWVRVAGGYNLYRWSGQKLPVEADRIVGAAEAAAASIGNFPYVGHQASTCYWYLLRAVGAGGVEEGNCQQVVRAEFDDSGELVGAQPNRPQDLSVRPLAGGSFELRWTYSEEGQEVAPAVFEVFTDGGTGQLDYETPVGSVSYRAGRVHY
ncbi:MAG: hypothetical protein ACE5K7_04430, partial [Phycisphaerae bacterium]